MKKYVCSVCGFVYDESQGIPSAGIPAGTKWESLPARWVCPVCGAEKSEFREQGALSQVGKPVPSVQAEEELQPLSALETSALCSNLARGCEKQYMAKESAWFRELADHFKAAAAPAREPSLGQLEQLLEKDLQTSFPMAHAAAEEAGDRGALRALVWSEKVTRILKSLLSRYEKEGEAMLENSGVYVCTICGFIYIGDTPPALCPVCKVPSWKFEKVEGGLQA